MTTRSATATTFLLAALVTISTARAEDAREPSPADRRIATARAAVERDPKQPASYATLAMALAAKARETSDGDYYAQANAALDELEKLDPSNFDGRKARAWVLLGQHEFAAARDLARQLNKQVPDDLLVYAFLTDANAELGDYAAAERACQFMLDLRPGNIPALTRAAYLRELFGDTEGAAELLHQALRRTPFDEVEDRAWILVHLAHLSLLDGNPGAAESLLTEADALFPDYHYAVAMWAKVRAAQGRHADAADLLRRHVELAPHPENLYHYAEALRAAGKTEEADRAYADFEARALAESMNNDNANRELIAYYSGPGNKPTEAVRLADEQLQRRQDLHTLATAAWAMHTAGDPARAKDLMTRAVAPGYRDQELIEQAKAIGVAH